MAAATPQTTDPNLSVPIPIIPGVPIGPSVHIPGTSGGGGILGGITGPIHAAEFFADPHNWVRIGEIVLGLSLIGIGVFAAINGPKRTASAMQTGSKVVAMTPQGRAATVARKAQTAGKVAQHREYGRAVGRAQGRVAARKITVAANAK